MKGYVDGRRRTTLTGSLGLFLTLLSLLSTFTWAQAPAASSTVPTLVHFSGALTDGSGKPLTGVRGVTFFLYKESEGGAPLWVETQNVQADARGHFTVRLGSTTSQGLPKDLFASGEARWLGVQPAGQVEQPRVLLLSVPYAMKAADAETLGGLPASAFMLASSPVAAVSNSVNVSTSNSAAPPAGAITGGGTAGFLPDFTGATTVGNSAIFQSGVSPTAKIGINTNAPTTGLDVHGGAAIRGAFVLPATGAATAAAGKTSEPENLAASAFNSASSTAVTQTFQFKAEPVGNDTASATASLNVLFGQGTNAPTETGLKIASNGHVTFAAGQEFPGTGTVGSVALTVPSSDFAVSGSPVTGAGTLNLTWNVAPTSANTANAIVKRDGSGNFVGTTISAKDVETGTLNQIPIAAIATVGQENVFSYPQFFLGNDGYTIIGDPGCGNGYGAIGFQALSGCSNYSLTGNGTNTFVNAPTGGTIYFRVGNNANNIMTLDPGGALFIDSSEDGIVSMSEQSGAEGVIGQSNGGGDAFGVWGYNVNTSPGVGYGVVSTGPALVTGNLTVEGAVIAGTKDFRIDHPLDPANKYLYHASIESSEMMNLYTGNVTTDANGEATVTMPSWFEAVNTDFRYQLTVMGQFAQAIISRKLANNSFAIRTSVPQVEVSWQVTAVRHDPYALANPLVVEQAKAGKEVGHYIHPELYGQSEKQGMMWGVHGDKMRAMESRNTRIKQMHTQGPTSHPSLRATASSSLSRRPLTSSVNQNK